MTNGEPIEPLDWDTEFFGTRIARARASALESDQELKELIDACTSTEIECLYFLADSRHQPTADALTRIGFRFVDIRISLNREVDTRQVDGCEELTDVQNSPKLRKVRDADLPELSRVASESYSDSRFYADHRFERARCDELYRRWFERSCKGELADCVIVAEAAGQPGGFVTCRVNDEDVGHIGLMGVAQQFRGRGLARNLVHAALHEFGTRGANETRVVTQGRNVGAQRAYQSAGYRTQSVELWFHGWMDELELG